MPKLNIPNDYNCFYCNGQAQFISVNTKRPRCQYYSTQCPAVIATAQTSRDCQKDQIVSRLKVAGISGRKKLQELWDDPEYRQKRSIQMSAEIVKRGGHKGSNNPAFGTTKSQAAKQRMKQSAAVRDNSNIGKYYRTAVHRNQQSLRIISYNQQGKLRRTRDTKPELLFYDGIIKQNIGVTKQFLIQYGKLGKRTDWFRHAYDFKVNNLPILIEIDGTYWHSLTTTKQRDLLCEQKALQLGYCVVRISEQALVTNDIQCCEKVATIIKSCDCTIPLIYRIDI